MVTRDEPGALISTKLRERRLALGWSLRQAAQEAGISQRSLVTLEQGSGNPSLATLLRLAAAYGVALAELVEADDRPLVIVRRASDAQSFWRTPAGSEARLLIAAPALECWLWTLAPGDSRVSEPHRRGTKEVIRMLTGRIELLVAEHRHELSRRDIALFAGDQAHMVTNRVEKPATFELIVHEPVTGA